MGVRTMIAKLKEVWHAKEVASKKETSRINLDAELEAVKAKIEAEALAKIHEEARTAHAVGKE